MLAAFGIVAVSKSSYLTVTLGSKIKLWNSEMASNEYRRCVLPLNLHN